MRDHVFKLRIEGVESVIYNCLLIDHDTSTSFAGIIVSFIKRIVEKMCLSCYNHYIKINV